MQRTDEDLLKVKKELASMKADNELTTAVLFEKIAELSHPLESLIVSAIVDEVMNHCYFFENNEWPRRLPLHYKPKKSHMDVARHSQSTLDSDEGCHGPKCE